MCLLAFRLWAARDCAQGHGLRCAAGPDGLASSSLSRLADKPMEEELAPGPLRFAALAGRYLQCQKAKRRAASTASAHNPKGDHVRNLEHLDPTTVLIGESVRDTVVLDPQFVASIAQHGVLQPITAVRTDDGVEVRDGQRRTLAARQARLSSIPVYVLATAQMPPKSIAAERITQQIVANDHRASLTDAQRAKGINQMLLAGVSPTRISKALSVGRDTVTAAATVAKSPTALGALQSRQLSLHEAAALWEFENDERAVGILMNVAGSAEFDHRVAQLRQERITDQARIEAETRYADKGFTILEDRPMWRDTTKVSMRHLRTADGDDVTETAVAEPTQWAVFMVEDAVIVDAATGEPVDGDDVDWSTEHHPDRQPADGMRHADTVVEKFEWQPEYYCLDPQACGLTLTEVLTRAKPIVAGHDAGKTEAQAEATRNERRKVLVLNKLGVAAQEVRRAWVREHLLSRKTPVKGRRCLWRRLSTPGRGCWPTTPASRSSANCSASATAQSVLR